MKTQPIHVAAIAAVLLSLVLWTPNAATQTINTEELRPSADLPGWSLSTTGTASVTGGNVEVINLGAKGRVRWQSIYPTQKDEPTWLRQATFLQASTQFSESMGVTSRLSHFAHWRWTAMWWKRLGSEVFAQLQVNRFLRLKARTLVGTGARVVLVNTTTFRIFAGTGIMAEHEKLLSLVGTEDQSDTIFARSTSYLTTRATLLDGKLIASNTIYVQPRVDDLDDIRALEEFTLAVPIGEHLTFSTSFSYQRDTTPPTDVEKTDKSLASSLEVSW
jgi:putative salt-induced outer membrane protein YdiY